MVRTARSRGDQRLPGEPLGGPLTRSSASQTQILDPLTAYRLGDQPLPRPTAYVADSLLVRGWHEETERALRSVAATAGFRVVWDDGAPAEDHRPTADLDLIRRARLSATDEATVKELWVSRVRLASLDTRTEAVFRPVDTWRLLQSYRAEVSDRRCRSDLALEHPAELGIGADPYTSSHGVRPTPYTSSHPYAPGRPTTGGRATLEEYAVAGSGGRQPVAWMGGEPVPARPPLPRARRPVVVVVDSGVGQHPWLGPAHVDHEPEVLGERIGLESLQTQARAGGRGVPDLVGELGPDAGHGTFVAGLVRQTCPEARIVSVRLFRDSGVVDEYELLRALQLLCLRQLVALRPRSGLAPFDVVTISLGYYHERPEDDAYDPLLRGPLELLGSLGVAVVASAGNDATSRPCYPAAFAPRRLTPATNRGRVPLSAVGALNPDGTVAMFSNDGAGVHHLRPGAGLVSTVPTDLDGSLGATRSVVIGRGQTRATIDPDDFRSGFAVWSGTSFAAPLFAGQLAARLVEPLRRGGSRHPRAAAARTNRALGAMPRREEAR